MKRVFTALCAALCLSTVNGFGDVVNLYFAGGQSNAKVEWASAIEARLGAVIDNVEVVHIRHSGNAMSQWYTTSVQANYEADFFNASATGKLETAIADIEAAGDDPVFRGFFWFQGEGDTASTNTMDLYSGRFNGMLSELKSDLGMSNDIDFTMALIDMNSDSLYDDPANTSGRTRGDIEYLRMVQSNICNSTNGSFEDTREYDRLDSWHLPITPDLVNLGTAMAEKHAETFGAVVTTNTVSISSHSADGAIYGTSGVFTNTDLFAARIRETPYNGVAFFEIPEGEIVDAELSFTVVTDEGVLTDGINLDMWALGYQSTPSLSAAWMLQDDTDIRLLLNGKAPVKIADNFVDAGEQTDAGSVWKTSASEGQDLAEYINGILSDGAVPGDYMAIRINPDGVITNYSAGARFGASNHANQSQVPILTVKYIDKVLPSVDTGYWNVGSHSEDGAISESGGRFTTQTLISSTGGNGPEPWSGVCFFELPPQVMTDASMRLKVETDYMPSTIITNVDLWGLGYQRTPYLNKDWYISAENDTRILLNGEKPVKIADDMIESGVNDFKGGVWSPDASEKITLKKYINNLFMLGAKPGDYAVFRVNMDARVYGINYGIRWGASDTDGYEPSFTGNFIPAENLCLNPGMEMGDQDDSITFWSVSLNNFLYNHTNVNPRTGSYVMRMGVGGDQTGNTADNINTYQTVQRDDWNDKHISFSCYAQQSDDEPLVATSNAVQRLELRLWCLDANSQNIGYVDSRSDQNLYPSSPTNEWMRISVSTTCPAGTVYVRPMFIFRTGTTADQSITNGAVLIDDARLEIFEQPVAQGALLILR
ncbi:MAG: hypothetical protein PF904_16940 [Kiritimatiellae bacterium]|jgi:hypothetical protein|nr:hypothetical protein [Kiritimatiellia bacterium]